mgnify:CR=1 FL=1
MYTFASPTKLIWKIKWKIKKKELKKCGAKGYMGEGFKLISPQYISIGEQFHAGRDCQLCAFDSYQGKKHENSPEIIIGNQVTITDRCYISCINKIEIGNGCLFGINTFITDNYHGKGLLEELKIPPNQRKLFSKGPVIIGSNVWTGRNVCIMPGVKIGDGAVIGANAVVTHDIPANSVAAGVPARIIKQIE